MTDKLTHQPLLSRRAFVGNAMAGLAGMSAAGRGVAAELSTGNSEITSLTALQLSSAIKAKQVSCKEVMSQYLGQIDRYNGRFNAAVSLADSDFLLADADRADADLTRRGTLPRLDARISAFGERLAGCSGLQNNLW